MPKLDKEAMTLDHLAQMVEKGFFDVRSELSKKADKADIAGLQTDISQLAVATKLGFDEVHSKFEVMDSKFKKVDDRFEEIDEQFKKIDARFDGIDQKLSNLDNRLDTFVTHEKRLVKVERELGFAV